MKTYGQYCGVARALDVIGDRWSLLIMREVMLRDCRFTDLRDGLPGIASNLLTQRLRDLEAAGLLERFDAPPPVATTLYRATDRGHALRPVLRELVRWAFPMMATGAGDDARRGHWIYGAADALFHGADLEDLAPLRVVLHAEDATLTLAVDEDGALDLAYGDDPDADARISGTMQEVVQTLAGLGGTAEVSGDRRRVAALASRSQLPV